MPRKQRPRRPAAAGHEWMHDPDFGWIERPIATLPNDQEQQRVEELRRKDWPRLWPDASISTCDACDAKAFVGRSDLAISTAVGGVVYTFFDIKGGQCKECGAQSVENNDIIRIESHLGVPFPGTVATYEAKVARLGSGSLGTYWPRDIQRRLRLKQGMKAGIEVVDEHTVLVRFT